jgi:hypothetical protein
VRVFKSLGIGAVLFAVSLGRAESFSQSPAVTELLALADRTVELTQLALQHVSFSFFALTVRDAQWHAQSAINLLEGPSSPRYDPQYGAPTATPGAVSQAKELVERLKQSEFASDSRGGGQSLSWSFSARLTSGSSVGARATTSRRFAPRCNWAWGS